MTKLPVGAVIIGPNTLSGHQPEQFGEFATPPFDAAGQKFDNSAARVALWFRTWDEAKAFVAAISSP